MVLPRGDELARRLLGHEPDKVETLLVRVDRAVFRVAIGSDSFVCKVDVDVDKSQREAKGQTRARAVGIPVPEIVAVGDGALAMRFVAGVPLARQRVEGAWRAAGRVLRRVHALEADGLWGDGTEVPRSTWRAVVTADIEQGLADCARDFGFDPAQAARIRDALVTARELDAPIAAWCHGDCQPDHILIDPATNDVVAIIDWSDHGKADAAWDIAVLTLDDEAALSVVLDGYAPDADARSHIEAVLPLLRVARWLGEAHWLLRHGYPYEESLERALEWTP